MPLKPEIVGKLFDTMETPDSIKTVSADCISAQIKKTPSSFVDGKWLHSEPLKKEPWIHQEEKVVEKTFWNNYEALGQWSNLTAENRRDYIKHVGEVLMKQATEIGDLETTLHKAPSQLISKEVLPFLANYWVYYSGWAALENTENRQFDACGSVVIDVRRSNFPLLEGCMAAAPALASGCVVTVVGHKRLESLLFLASKSNLPSGVLNIVVTSGNSDPSEADFGRTSALFGPIRPSVGCTFGNWETIDYFSGRSCMLVLSHSDFEGAARSLLENTTKRSNLTPWPVSEVLIQEHLFQPFASYLEKILPQTGVCQVKWPQANITAVRKYAKDEGLKLLESGEAVILINGRYEEVATSKSAEDKPYVVGLLPTRSLPEALSIINSRPRILSASVWSHDSPLISSAISGLKVPVVWTNQHGFLPVPSITVGSSLYSGGGQWGGIAGLLNFKQWRPTVCDKGAHRHETKWSDDVGSTLLAMNMLLDGRLVPAATTKVLIGRNDKPVVKVNIPNSKEVSSAIASCQKAFTSWSTMPQSARAEALTKLCLSLTKAESNYAQLLNDYGVEGTKIAASEIKVATSLLSKWSAKALTNQVLQIKSDAGWTSRQVALGVIAVAGPIEGLGPLLGLLAPALAAGNCVVLSASPREPLAALHLAQVASAGLPPGVLNIVGPGAQTHLAAHPEVAAMWIGLRDTNQLTSETSKRLWRVDYACLESCPDDFLLHQATNCKTVYSA